MVCQLMKSLKFHITAFLKRYGLKYNERGENKQYWMDAQPAWIKKQIKTLDSLFARKHGIADRGSTRNWRGGKHQYNKNRKIVGTDKVQKMVVSCFVF